jgi:L-alanine-DL-glutamate epimerase-like enolase superfamily enzyme
MKIDGLVVRRLTGTMPIEGLFWEERLVRPIDVYPEYRRAPWRTGGEQLDDRHFRTTQDFLEIRTDGGVRGIAGPLWPDPARIVLTQLAHLLLGKDPLATELLWDQMHRFQVHGRQGDAMIALSAVDCALWDIKGQVLGQPIWRLLGGPTRDEMPAYASMLGYAVEDPGLVRERALRCRAQGFTAQKWFFRHGPMSGPDGLRKNVELVRTLRETLGDGYDIMLDCWQSMSPDYAVELCARIEEYRPRWLEEVFMPDRIDSYVKLKAKTRIPLAGAEHEYTRWGFKRFIERDALDVLQPDIYWCGGLSETLKIAAYATTHDLVTIPHGHSTPMTIHFSVTQSPVHTPYQEYLVKWNAINMFFLKHPLHPVGGAIRLPEAPGANMALDADRIERDEEIRA